MKRLLAAVVVAACGGRAPAPTPVTPPDVARHDADDATAEAPATDGKATPADCTAVIDHMIDLDVAERPGDQRPSSTELDKARGEMRSQFGSRCAQELTHAQADCIVHAASTDMAKACSGTLFHAK